MLGNRDTLKITEWVLKRLSLIRLQAEEKQSKEHLLDGNEEEEQEVEEEKRAG